MIIAMGQSLVIRRKLLSLKTVIILFLCILSLIPLGSYLHDIHILSKRMKVMVRREWMHRWHATYIEEFFSARVIWPASKLGRIMFDQERIPKPNLNANRIFVVLVWKHWNWLKKRHVFNFGKPGYTYNENNLLQNCSVNNCIFSSNVSLINTADAVLVHLQKGLIPKVKNRKRTQRWIFLNDESPRNAFSLAKQKPALNSLYNVFNWSMTYRSDADVPVPYGRTIALKKPLNLEYNSIQDMADLVPNWKRKKRRRLAAVVMSNCGVNKSRNDFLKKLRKHVKVDVYLRCSDKEPLTMRCPGQNLKDCDVVKKYLFYLVLENSSCFQYLTEKVFYYAYTKGAIPVIFGPTLEDVENLLPPDSYLHANAQTNIKELARNMKTLAATTELLLGMHMWRNHFKIVNEHGYFGTKSYHLCRVCEALNYNDAREKIYDKERLDVFLDPSRTCN